MKPELQLRDYIEQELDKGKDYAELMAELRSSGWTDELITHAVGLIGQEEELKGYSEPEPEVELQPTPTETDLPESTPEITQDYIPSQTKDSTAPRDSSPEQERSDAIHYAPYDRFEDPMNATQRPPGAIPGLIAGVTGFFNNFGNSPRQFMGLVVGGLLAALLLVAFFMFLLPRINQPELTQFNDPNFTLQIPIDWRGDGNYTVGDGLILFYSSEDANDQNREKAAYLSMYIGVSPGRIDRQLEDLGGGQYEMLVDEVSSDDGVDYRYIEVAITPEETPDRELYLASVVATRGDFAIAADFISIADYWDLHADEAKPVLLSIRPACDKVPEERPDGPAICSGV